MARFPGTLLFSLLLWGPGGYAQTHVFTNLARTQEQYLHRFAQADNLDRFRQQLVNLPAISDASYVLDSTGGDTIFWTLEESRTRFPLIDFGGLKGNINYLVGYKDIHFRGRGEELSAYYRNNQGEHNFGLAFRNPSIGGSRWGYGFELVRYASREPLYFSDATVNYRYANLTLGAMGQYALRPTDYLSFGASVFREDYEKLAGQPESPGPEGLEQHKFLIKFGYDRDRRDFHWERREGTRHTTNLQTVLTAGQRELFFLLLQDIRYFKLLGERGNLAARLRAGIGSNDNTPFAPFVLDSQVNIRGSGNRIDRGTAQFVLNLEYRYSFFRNKRNRYVLQAVAFSDFGTWRNPGGGLDDLVNSDSFRHFVGGGLRIASPKVQNAVFRVDYGVELLEPNRRGVVVGVGQYF